MKQEATNAWCVVVWPTNPNAKVPSEHTTSPPSSMDRCPNLRNGWRRGPLSNPGPKCGDGHFELVK